MQKKMMLPSFKILIVGVIYLLGTTQESMAYCSSYDYSKALKDFLACPELDPEDLGSLIHLAETCRTLECTLECLVNAIGDCKNYKYFKVVDMEMFKAFYRYACSAPDDTVKAIEDCSTPVLENECIAAKNAGIQQANLYFLLNSDIDEYINDFCGVVTAYKTCAPPSPIRPTATCSADQAAIINNLLELDVSVSGCDQAHTNDLFVVHGGPTRCGKKTTVKPTGTVSSAFAISSSLVATASTPRATTRNSSCLLKGTVFTILIGLLLSIFVY